MIQIPCRLNIAFFKNLLSPNSVLVLKIFLDRFEMKKFRFVLKVIPLCLLNMYKNMCNSTIIITIMEQKLILNKKGRFSNRFKTNKNRNRRLYLIYNY